MCHLILLMPLLGLPLFWLWPLSLALPVYVVILLLSAWFYYYAMLAMRQVVVVGRETLLHTHGKVVRAEPRDLRVRVQSELWRARSGDDLHPGDDIEVIGVDGLRLRVKRLEDDAEPISPQAAGPLGASSDL